MNSGLLRPPRSAACWMPSPRADPIPTWSNCPALPAARKTALPTPWAMPRRRPRRPPTKLHPRRWLLSSPRRTTPASANSNNASLISKPKSPPSAKTDQPDNANDATAAKDRKHDQDVGRRYIGGGIKKTQAGNQETQENRKGKNLAKTQSAQRQTIQFLVGCFCSRGR